MVYNYMKRQLQAVPQELYRSRYPAIRALDKYYAEDKGVPPEGNVVARNICVGGQWLSVGWHAQQTMLEVRDNYVGADPGFLAPEKADFRLARTPPLGRPAFGKSARTRLGWRKTNFEKGALRRREGNVEDSRIRPCTPDDFEAVYAIINDAARAYRGVIPADRYHEPYMPREELREAIRCGVVFWGYEEAGEPPAPQGEPGSAPQGEPGPAPQGELAGVMGIQDVQDVTLIRHAYVRTDRRQQGIGSQLLDHLRETTARPVLVGTWADATWAIRFYQKHGFRLVSTGEKDRLLKRYWSIPDRQVETSVVLADARWRAEKLEVRSQKLGVRS